VTVAGSEALEQIAAIRAEVEAAADEILSAAERALQELAAAREAGAAGLEAVEAQLCAILQACAFQDLTGQRLTRLEAIAAGLPAAPSSNGLLNGPALPGRGLDQAAADLLMSATPSASCVK
jgi:hypothetical protein